MSSRNVAVSIHRSVNTRGFLVRLAVEGGEGEKIAKYPTSTMEEAEALAESIREYVGSRRASGGSSADPSTSSPPWQGWQASSFRATAAAPRGPTSRAP